MSHKIKNNNKKIKFEIKEDLKELNIINFKQFNDITFRDLGKINIFLGGNNTGKTSILEAVFMMSCGYNISPGLSLLTNKRDRNIKGFYDYSERITSIFKNANDSYKFKFNAKFINRRDYELVYEFIPSGNLSSLDNVFNSIDALFNQKNPYVGKLKIGINGQSREYEIDYPNTRITAERPIKVAQMHDILIHRESNEDFKIYSQLKRTGVLDEFLKKMEKVFPIIKEIDYIPYPDGNSGDIYIKNSEDKLLPLYSFGDGMRRWFSLLGSMIINQDSIHCIEEIDSTFHYEAQMELSKRLFEYSIEYNNQLFITSHSIEFIDQFLEGLYGENGILDKKSGEDIVRIFTLKRNKNKIDIWKLTGREAYEKRLNYDLELR